jgi:GT2 family glycosyltransferase
MQMKLSIIICCYNNWAYTKYCLTHLSHLSNDYELVIVDNASTDETEKEIKNFNSPNLVYIRNDKNYMYGAGNNIGYKRSTGDQVMFLNNDIKILDKDLKWFNELVDFIDKQDNALIGPTCGMVDSKNGFQFMYETEDSNKPVNYMSGWCMTAKRETWNSLIENDQLFDERFSLYFEDTDIGFRCLQKGINFIIYKLPLSHIGKQTSKKLNISKYYTDSRQKFIKKWAIKK